jgi:hypothetical protein
MEKVILRYPALLKAALQGSLVFHPAPPGDKDPQGKGALTLPETTVTVEVMEEEMGAVREGLKAGALNLGEAQAALQAANPGPDLNKDLLDAVKTVTPGDWNGELEVGYQLDKLALIAIKIFDRAQKSLLAVAPLTSIRFQFTEAARVALSLCWEAMMKRGKFPLPPQGAKRFLRLRAMPCGALHFVSASDLDAGYFYTMGIALSPEAQSLKTMDLSYGLDGELIVPGQAVSPIPPFLSMATRMFAASIPTSSNISEEVQSIPMRNFPHPTSIDDLEPRRGGLLRPPVRPRNTDEAVTDLRQQLLRYEAESLQQQGTKEAEPYPDGLPKVGAVYEVTGLTERQIGHQMSEIYALAADLAQKRELIALYLDIESAASDRVEVINRVVDAAATLGLKYVAVADDVEDSWLPGLLEYLEPDELNDVADYADLKGVIVIDGRPIDPVYTAATAAQRIQSVFSTLSVDILKMGMWLCLDALSARRVWREILSNPHIPSQMLLMPIGIVEPWDAFADNRNPERTQRAILDPFEKIKFMIEEAQLLKIPSLLTDTRHKNKWVLLGRKTPQDQAHLREKFITGPNGEFVGRTSDSAIPLLSWEEFMECERLAREAGILLGQAGSIEAPQAFQIISETTYDAAKQKCNPASAIWTAETERVLRTASGQELGDLQLERSSAVSPFLAVVNRGQESHAKVDGWLRYLEERGKGEPGLRQDLNTRRDQLAGLLETCIQSQQRDRGRYQESWDAYRRAYLEYHNLIKSNFGRVRQQVADLWAQS